MTMTNEERPRVLIVDDEKFIRDIHADFLGMEGYVVRTAEDGQAALNELTHAHYDLVISDLKMPRMGGIELLEQIGTAAPNALTVIMTGFGTVETAIDAMKRGAYDYILKPFKVEEVIHVVQRGLEKRKLQAENLRLKEALSLYKVSEAIAASLSLDEVMRTVTDAAIHEVDADHALVLLEDGVGGYYERACELHPDFRPRSGVAKLNAAELAEFFKEDKPVRVHGQQARRYFSEVPDDLSPHSLVVTALAMRHRNMGFLGVVSYTRGKKFDE